MIRRLISSSLSLLLLGFSLSCSRMHLDPGEEIVLPAEMFGNPSPTAADFSSLPAYTLLAGDVLELLFHFHTTMGQEFKLLPEDIVAVKFPDLPQLNEEQKIRPDGLISLPYIGEYKAAGMTPSALTRELKRKYAAILNKPEVYVVVREYGGTVQELKTAIQNTTRGQSKLVSVRTDGYATFPLLGDMKVVGKTIGEVSKEINDQYVQISPDFKVDVFLQESVGSKVAVLGAVTNPGFYPITHPVSVLEALALAGGARTDANLSTVLALRREGDRMKCRAFDVGKSVTAHPKATHMFVTTNDIVYVPRTKLSEVAQVVSQITDITNILYFRGWGFNFTYDLNQDDNNNSRRVITTTP